MTIYIKNEKMFWLIIWLLQKFKYGNADFSFSNGIKRHIDFSKGEKVYRKKNSIIFKRWELNYGISISGRRHEIKRCREGGINDKG